MSAEEGFLAAIAQEPGDRARRLVFSDWLEEQGRFGAARARRWLAAGNRPWSHTPDDGPATWTWFVWSAETLRCWEEHGLSDEGMLPRHPTMVLSVRKQRNETTDGVVIEWWDFASRQQAKHTLMEAWPDGEDAR